MSLKDESRIIEKISWSTFDHKMMEYSLVEFPNKDLAIIEKKIGSGKFLNGDVQKEVEFERVINYGNDKVVELFNRIKQKAPQERSVTHSVKKIQINTGETFKGIIQNIVAGEDNNKMHNIIIKNGNRKFVLRTNSEGVINKLKVGQSLSIKQTEQGLKVNLVRGLKR